MFSKETLDAVAERVSRDNGLLAKLQNRPKLYRTIMNEILSFDEWYAQNHNGRSFEDDYEQPMMMVTRAQKAMLKLLREYATYAAKQERS